MDDDFAFLVAGPGGSSAPGHSPAQQLSGLPVAASVGNSTVAPQCSDSVGGESAHPSEAPQCSPTQQCSDSLGPESVHPCLAHQCSPTQQCSDSLESESVHPSEAPQCSPLQPPHGAPESHWWASAVLSCAPVQDYLQHLRGARLTLHYASDCTGADAPWFALRDLREALAGDLGCVLEVVHEFSSEHPGRPGDAPRQWCAANCPPRVFFSDMHARVAGGGVGPATFCRGGKGTLPEHVHIYVGGFECVGNTHVNRFKRAKTDSPRCADPESSSYHTYVSSVATIRSLRPDFWVLENTRGCPVQATCENLRCQLQEYVVQCLSFDAVNFYSRAHRYRNWFCGMKHAKCRLRPTEWANFLEACSRHPSAVPPAHVWMSPVSPFEEQHARLGGHAAPPSGGETGPTWAWVGEHLKVREATGRECPLTPAQVQRLCLRGLATYREADLVTLLTAHVKATSGDPAKLDLFWDVSAEASHSHFLDQEGSGFLQCFLSSHKQWSTRRHSVLSGVEHMWLQGFPVSADRAGLSSAKLRALAGKTMSVPSVGCVLLLGLTAVDWGGSVSPEELAVLQALSSVPAQPVVCGLRCNPARLPRSHRLPGFVLQRLPPLGAELPLRVAAEQVVLADLPLEAVSPVQPVPGLVAAPTSGRPEWVATPEWVQWASARLADPSVTVVDLSPLLTCEWVTALASAVPAHYAPVWTCGLQCLNTDRPLVGGFSAGLADCSVAVRLASLLAEVVHTVWPLWTCTTVHVEQGFHKAGAVRAKGCAPQPDPVSARVFQFTFPLPQTGQADWEKSQWEPPVPGSSASGTSGAGLTFFRDETHGHSALGPVAGECVRYPWGRERVSQPGQPLAPWLGDLYSTPGRLLAFFPDKERVESKWPEPGSCTRVTWATAPAHDYEVAPSSVQQVLGQCGLRHLPVPPVSAADSDSPPVDDFGALL